MARVWPTQDELDAYLWRRAEAKKRDHRRLGVQLDLFSFHDISPGSAFWHPKGQQIWRTLEGAMRELQARRGYQEISTPIVVSERLWRQSGHWDLYRDNMFLIESEGQTFSLKPMNCPESTFVYRSHLRSYRDLPLRFSEFGRLHRNERSGTLSGLTRVRQFIQDDAHLYVRPDQLTAEIEALLGEVRESYGWFGLTPRFAFATKPDKALGDPALWDRAEQLIREAFAAADISYTLKPKDGTFYAPKIDIYIDDALGREWQMATIQVDLVMLPERFDLTYIDENGQPQRPIAIHRAIYGSLERFIGILVEHFAGAFPLWLAPVQAVDHPDRRSSSRGCPRAGRHPPRARSADRGRRIGQPDAEQDPARPGAEDPVHAGARRPRGRGENRRSAGPERRPRRAAGGGRVGRPRRSAGRREPRTTRLRDRPGSGLGRPSLHHRVRVVQELEIWRIVPELGKVDLGVPPLLLAVGHDVDEVVPEREAVAVAEIHDRDEVVVGQGGEPRPHLVLVLCPEIRKGVGGRIVVGGQRGVPYLAGLAAEPSPPAHLHVERVDERASKVPIRDRGRPHELLDRDGRDGLKHLPIRPVGEPEEGLDIGGSHTATVRRGRPGRSLSGPNALCYSPASAGRRVVSPRRSHGTMSQRRG